MYACHPGKLCVCETKNTSACFFLEDQHFLFLGVHVVLSVFPEACYISKAQRTIRESII